MSRKRIDASAKRPKLRAMSPLTAKRELEALDWLYENLSEMSPKDRDRLRAAILFRLGGTIQ